MIRAETVRQRLERETAEQRAARAERARIDRELATLREAAERAARTRKRAAMFQRREARHRARVQTETERLHRVVNDHLTIADRQIGDWRAALDARTTRNAAHAAERRTA